MQHEPEWWSRARVLYRNPRLSLKAVARILEKHDTTVLYAVDEGYRERKRKANNQKRAAEAY